MSQDYHVEGPVDISDDLARSLPRWVGWIPVVGKLGYKRWCRWRGARRADNQIQIQPLEVRIEASTLDQAWIHARLLVVNFGKKPVEADRFELVSASVGSRQLQRRANTLNMEGEVAPRSIGWLHFSIDLYGPDIRNLVQGVTKAPNARSYPYADTSINGRILFLGPGTRFKKGVQFQLRPVSCEIAAQVSEAFGD